MKTKTNKWMIGIMVFAVFALAIPKVYADDEGSTITFEDVLDSLGSSIEEAGWDALGGRTSLGLPRDWDEFFRNHPFWKWLTRNDFPGMGNVFSSLLGAGIGGYDEWLEEWQQDLGEFMCDSVVLAGTDCWISAICARDEVPDNPETGGGTAMLPSGDIGAWIKGKKTADKNIPVLCNASDECPWGVQYGESWSCRGGLCINNADQELVKVYMYTMTYYLKNPFDEITPELPGVDYEDYEDHEPFNITHWVSWKDINDDTGNFWTVESKPTWSTIAEGESLSFYGTAATPIYSPREFKQFCLHFDPQYPILPDDFDTTGMTEQEWASKICTNIVDFDPSFYSNPEAGEDTPGATSGGPEDPPPAASGGMV